MTGLLDLQRRLRATVLDGGLDGGEDRDLTSLVVGAPEMARTRLAVYRNNVRATLTTALKLNFPALAQLVGTEFFAASAARFLAVSPPGSADLHEYGETFPAFLANLPSTRHLVFLGDVGRLEWAAGRALHAPHATPLGLAMLAALTPEQQAALRFLPHPSLSLLSVTTPARAIWEAVLTPEEELREQRLAAIDPGAGGENLAVLHACGEVVARPLSPAAFAFAQALIAGAPFAEALAIIPEGEASAALGGFLSDGFFTAAIPSLSPEEEPCHDRTF